MCAALTRKNARRKGMRASIDKVHDEICKLLVDFKETDRVKVRGKQKTLLDLVSAVKDVDEEILDAVAPEDIEGYILEATEFIGPIDVTIEELSAKLQQNDNVKQPVADTKSDVGTTERHCRLPKLELPVFKGNPLNWNEFWDQFKASIHHNDTINDVDRFSYLKRYLSDSALATISGLCLTSENYKEAVTLLENRYGNQQVQITAHMASLLKIRKVRSMDNVQQLRELYNDVENCVRNLKSLKVETNTYGSLLIPVLNERLPEDLRVLISRKFGSAAWTFDDMLRHLNDEIQAIERCATLSRGVNMHPDDERKAAKGLYTTANLHIHSDRSDRKKRCVYCLKDHPPSQCTTVTNTEARIAILRKYAKCFTCLSGGHISRSCQSNYRCKRCKRKHHISICKNDVSNSNDGAGFEEHTSTTHAGTSSNILLQTAKAAISPVGSDNSLVSRLMFDSGSQRSYVSKKLSEKLKLKSLRKERIVIKTFGTMDNKLEELDVVQFKVKNREGDNYVYVEALSVPTICCPITRQNIKASKDEFGHLAELELADYSDGSSDLTIDILIGLDFYYSFVTNKIIRGKEGPVAVKSSLGWILGGSAGTTSGLTSHCSVTHSLLLSGEKVNSEEAESSDGLREQLQKFWSVESVGHVTKDCVIHEFEKDIRFDGCRYVTKLPFRPDHDELPDNFNVCKRRLVSLIKRLKGGENRKLLDDYDKIFVDYEKDRIIEKVPADEIAKPPGTVYYLPHHPVIRENKTTTKVRPVFDASCKANKPTLNDCLYPGPNLLPKIFGILLRFRTNYVAILADIKQAFLNVGVSPEHKDYLRFLWLQDITKEDAEVIVLRFLRVVFGVNSSPFLLNGTIRHHLEKYIPTDIHFIERLLEDLYVDDVTSGCEDVVSGVEFYDKAKKIMLEGGFNLRKWVTNDQNLQSIINEKESVANEPPIVSAVDDSTFADSQFAEVGVFNKVLGLEWDTVNDEFVFHFKSYIEKVSKFQPTKRNILRAASSLYDPLGLISPITTRLKILFQLLCRDKHGWDEIVSEEIDGRWKEFLRDLLLVNTIRVKRFVFHEVKSSVLSIQLHGFADSSQQAYAGLIYLRVQDTIGVRVNLFAAKSKVVPLKSLSIPRLELLACCLLVTLFKDVTSSVSGRVEIGEVLGWSDSKVALCWIKGKSKCWKSWVENRVVAIRDVVPAESWNYVESASNPADIPTRINEFSSLRDGRWFNGPTFLHNETIEFEKFDEVEKLSSDDVTEESRKSSKIAATCMRVDNKCIDSIGAVIDIKRYSSLRKLLMVTGYVLRFTRNLISKVRNNADAVVENEVLELEEYNYATDKWIKNEQCIIRNCGDFEKLKASLNLYDDEHGFLRLRGRFGNSSLTKAEKHPILLPKDSSFTKLVVLDAHDEVLHHGIEATLAKVRARYWIVRGRVTVKTILRKCVICKKIQGRPLLAPSTPDLPDYRICASHSFQATGLDYAGPLMVRDIAGKNAIKVYILLLTCATSRAIHLELTPGMTNDAFIRGFTRFLARRGSPDVIISDNFKTFRSKEVKCFMIYHGIKQKFILPASPWWGGFYERFVRTVKASLKKVVGKALLTFEELETILCKVERVINGRPLVYTSEDDIAETITPFHLMSGRNLLIKSSNNMPVIDDAEFNAIDCSQRIKYLEKVIHDYWRRFEGTYLNELRQYHIYESRKTNNENKLRVGDVVLIRDDVKLPRVRWKMGLVNQLVTGKDGYVRGARLTVISDTGKRTTACRPIQKLIPFEITSGNNDESTAMNEQEPVKCDDSTNRQGEIKTVISTRPRRKAAITGEETRRLQQLYS